ncbi:glutathione binding-like protein [uncultured Massilia sp.]|uniref:glutathione binding-like protein n=1 Tax=uncultured Massilia sp. TaxID=169973 RepID=UPI0025E21C3E|nr:glutathione binding-like protein [uncultured Massilia sp.]
MPHPLDAFPAARKWPARHPERLQLYSMPTPNGVKPAIMLEETGLPYEAHRVAFERDEQHSPAFLALNPNNKIPAIIDPDGPGGRPLPLWESVAILVYLADKTGMLAPRDPARRHETLQWMLFQAGSLAPMAGQLGFFVKFAGKDWEDKRPRDRFAAEVRRVLGVLDGHLAGRDWIMGDDYTIADIATFPWVNAVFTLPGADELAGTAGFANVARVLDAFLARPAVARGMTVPS